MKRIQHQVREEWTTAKRIAQNNPVRGKKALQNLIEKYDKQSILVEGEQIPIPLPEVVQAKQFSQLLDSGQILYQNIDPVPILVSGAGVLLSGYLLYSGAAIDAKLMNELDEQRILLENAKELQNDANLRYGLGYGVLALTLGYGTQAFLYSQGFHLRYQNRW